MSEVAAPAEETAYLPGLIWTLVRTDFKTRYHGTVGGYLWALAKPASMFVVLLSVFSFVFRTSPDYKLDLIIGLCLWEFFAEASRSGLGSIHAKAFLLTRATFPRWVVVVTSVANAFITACLFSIVICAYLLLSGHPLPLLRLGLYLLYLGLFAIIVLGFSLATSVLFLRYRDLNQIWDMALQAGFFVAPVIYPLDIIPERFHMYLYVWPPTAVIQLSRAVLVRGTAPSLAAHVLLAAEAAVALATGTLLFRWLAPRVMEEL
jgi:lipopolysaccharide transport system permease protein